MSQIIMTFYGSHAADDGRFVHARISQGSQGSLVKEKKIIMIHEKLVVGNKHFGITSYSIF